jgi:hypothetical protein
VARHRATLAEALRDGPAARVADARDRQWDILRDAGRLPVAVDAERSAAVGDDLPLVRRATGQRFGGCFDEHLVQRGYALTLPHMLR